MTWFHPCLSMDQATHSWPSQHPHSIARRRQRRLDDQRVFVEFTRVDSCAVKKSRNGSSGLLKYPALQRRRRPRRLQQCFHRVPRERRERRSRCGIDGFSARQRITRLRSRHASVKCSCKIKKGTNRAIDDTMPSLGLVSFQAVAFFSALHLGTTRPATHGAAPNTDWLATAELWMRTDSCVLRQ